jgi:hypothetical protein
MLETVKEDQNKLAAVVGKIAAGTMDAPETAVEIEEDVSEEGTGGALQAEEPAAQEE